MCICISVMLCSVMPMHKNNVYICKQITFTQVIECLYRQVKSLGGSLSPPHSYCPGICQPVWKGD